MAINFQKAQNAMNHTKELARKHTHAWVHFSHTPAHTYTLIEIHTHRHTRASTYLTLRLYKGMVCTCVCLRELTRRPKWCPISYLSAPRVYLPGHIIICWPSHMIWEREVQNPGHPREPSQDVMRDTGLWPNTLSHTCISTSTCTIWPLPFSFKSPSTPWISFPLTSVTLCCPFFNPFC